MSEDPLAGAPPADHPASLYIGSVERLAGRFDLPLAALGVFQSITPAELPADYRTLLAHTGHMTVTLEAFHNTLVDVGVIQERTDEASYAREIVLTRQSDGSVVQYGLVRIWLGGLPDDVVAEIRARQTPLGRVLIRHGLLRDVELISLWRIKPGEKLIQNLRAAEDVTIYGRSAQILVDQRPTIQLLEIVRV